MKISALNVVAVSGGTSMPSRTLALANALSEGLERRLFMRSRVIRLQDHVRDIGPALSRDEIGQDSEAALRAIEGADLLVVASPVYRGSFPGQLKHLFDLVGEHALAGKPVLLAATGGSERHALVIEHQLRPLFSFFQALTLPVGVYASASDFRDYRITSQPLKARIELAVERALPLFPSHAMLLRETA